MLAVGLASFVQHLIQGGLALALLLGALTLGRVCVVFGDLQAVALRQVLHGFDETHARVFHQKTNGVTVFAATKTMEKLLGGTD